MLASTRSARRTGIGVMCGLLGEAIVGIICAYDDQSLH